METAQESGPEETRRSTATPSQYLTFRLAEETYAVGILQAREILRYEELTKVPSTPDSIRGVLNLRGSVVPVVDLAVKFGLVKSSITKWTCIVIVETVLDGEDAVMGILADSVSEVLSLTETDIEPPPPFGTKVHMDYLVGMGKAERKFILILDIDKVLSKEDVVAVYETEGANEAAETEPSDGGSDKTPDTVEARVSEPQTENENEEKTTTKPYTNTISDESDAKPQAPTLSNQVGNRPQVRTDKSPQSTVDRWEKAAKGPLQDKKVEKKAPSSVKQSAHVETNETEGDRTQKNMEEKASRTVEPEKGEKDSPPEKAKPKSEPDKNK